MSASTPTTPLSSSQPSEEDSPASAPASDHNTTPQASSTAAFPSAASYASVAAANVPVPQPSPSISTTSTEFQGDIAGTTPTAAPAAALHLTTPPSAVAASLRDSPAPTSSPTPNPHRRTLSSASASSSAADTSGISAVSSPARREFYSGDLSDSVLHEESETEAERAEGDDLFSAVSTSSVQHRPSSRINAPSSSLLSALGSGPRIPSTRASPAPGGQPGYRRSISVNTNLSSVSQPAAGVGGRHSVNHRQSQTGLSQASSRARQDASARRSVSRSGLRSAATSDGEEEGDGNWQGQDRSRAFSPPPPSGGGSARPRNRGRDRERRRNSDDGSDDEFVHRDRGEELVKKRARDRKREAKRLEARQQQQRISSYTSASATPAGEHPNALGLGYATGAGARGAARARDPSTARSEAYSTAFSDGMRSPVTSFHPVPPFSPPALSSHAAQRPGLGERGASYVSSISSSYFPQGEGYTVPSHSGSTASSVAEGSEAGETTAEEFEAEGEEGEQPLVEDGTRVNDWRNNGGAGTQLGDSSEDEDSDSGDVEYTLKDRQDAYNVEHPFGLPLWKPALYKKSRSIARRAESALHSAPSSTALHHLLPANLLWTIFFGAWFFVLCSVVSGLLWITPWGGGKYGRVIWELGTYLVWPFGKYVEGWTDGEDKPEEEDAGPFGDHAAIAEEEGDEEQYTADEESFQDDPEVGGQTFSRGRSGTINGTTSTGSTAKSRPAVAHVFHSTLPDEPLRRSDRTVRHTPSATSLRRPSGERAALLGNRTAQGDYGSSHPITSGGLSIAKDKSFRSLSEDTILGGAAGELRLHDFSKNGKTHPFRVRAFGRIMYWATFYSLIAPSMVIVCILCYFFVFTIPMAKLLWVLLRHLHNEPLSLHFRSPKGYAHVEQDLSSSVDEEEGAEHLPHDQAPGSTLVYPLRAGQPAPPVSRKALVADERKGRLRGPHPTVLLCTYRAAGLEYYKYTVDGVNIWFVNLMSLVFFAIADFFLLLRYVEHHPEAHKILHVLAGQAFIFVLSLLAVIPLSYFIGMAVASISAQSSIGMGAFVNASFGSIIEVILYSIALTQSKGELVEGSIVGSILAGVLLMPGLSMIGGAVKRKEQRFNAKSAGVTSTMLIMAVIGILTPTMFYEIYGSFQLTCTGCDVIPSPSGTLEGNTAESCRTCYYEHVSPADDPFYKSTVRYLSYFCAVVLVFSYAIGLWFSLRTHASQIWQNAAPTTAEHGALRPLSGVSNPQSSAADRRSRHGRLVPSQVFQPKRRPSASGQTPLQTPLLHPEARLVPGPLSAQTAPGPTDLRLPIDVTQDDFAAAFDTVPSAVTAPSLRRASSRIRETSFPAKESHEAEGHGGHDAPNWSRKKSVTVLLTCTFLYAVIAEILVDVVDVVLDGSGIPEKFLGVTLFALVPNTTEFMNAISFALNGNIALSMEIGSAYALQVCLIQAPAMLGFSAWYNRDTLSMLHRSFTLVFPRWDVIAILFSIFLLTYVYIESRSNYHRGVVLCAAYVTLVAGFAFAPANRDTSDNPGYTDDLAFSALLSHPTSLAGLAKVKALFLSIFSK